MNEGCFPYLFSGNPGKSFAQIYINVNIHKYVQMIYEICSHIYIHISFFLVKLFFSNKSNNNDAKKNIIRIINGIIFALFILEKNQI